MLQNKRTDSVNSTTYAGIKTKIQVNMLFSLSPSSEIPAESRAAQPLLPGMGGGEKVWGEDDLGRGPGENASPESCQSAFESSPAKCVDLGFGGLR